MKDLWNNKTIISIVVYIIMLVSVPTLSVAQQVEYRIQGDSTLVKDIKQLILNFPVIDAYKKLDFNTNHYKYEAFFCKMEEKMFFKTGKNIKFRLGSIDYVNKLENK